MDPKLQSLPLFIRAEPSPKIMDSAFPPFKVEHRYRGVYERAGFDINLGGHGSSRDNESRYSSKSHHHPQHSHRSLKSPGLSSQPSPTSATSKQFSVNSKKPYFRQQRQNSYQQQQQPGQPQNRSFSEHATPPRAIINNNFNSSTRSFSDTSSTQPNTNRSTDLFTNSTSALNHGHGHGQGNDTTLTSPPSSPDSPNLTDIKQGRKPPPRDSFNFSPQPTQLPVSPQQQQPISNPKNVKNLQLNLGGNSNSSSNSNAYNSYDTSHSSVENAEHSYDGDELNLNDTRDTSFEQPAGASPQFQFQNHHQQPSQSSESKGLPYPEQENLSTSSFNAPLAANQQQVLAPPANQNDANKQPRLSTLLDDFRKDIEDHKNYTPKSPTNSNSPSSAQSPPLPAMSPTQLGLTRFSPTGNNQSSEIQSDRIDNNEEDNNDYQRFLQGKLSPANPSAAANRTSQLSTVSSVISKSSNYDDDEEDDEIEKELQRQLETLKTSGNSKVEIRPEVSSFDEERSLLSTASNFPPYQTEDVYPTPQATESSLPNTIAPAPSVPIFTIDDAETTEAKARAQAAEVAEDAQSNLNSMPNQEAEDDIDFNDLSSHASFESVQPLSVRHSRIKPLNDEQLQHLQQSEVVPPLPQSNQIPSEPPQQESIVKREVNFADTPTTINTSEGYPHNHDDEITAELDTPFPQYPFNGSGSASPPLPSLSTHEGSLPYPTQEYHERQQDVTPEMPCADDFSRGTPGLSQNSSAPLSPHMHQVQEELSQMNFNMNVNTQIPYNPTDDIPESPGSDAYDEEIQPLNTKSIDAILAGAQQAQPQNAQSLKGQEPTKPQELVKYPPGEGPCRICHQDISPTATGSKKSIYSKTGELSGQWHRSCFTCAYDSSCSVKFNKSVQCYAWNDDAYCHEHYHELNGTLCLQCQLGIEGECIENELQQKWHLNCLKCEKCFDNINVDYYLSNNHIYCENDAMNIINGRGSYNGLDGNLRSGGLSTADRIEKRRTRVLFVD